MIARPSTLRLAVAVCAALVAAPTYAHAQAASRASNDRIVAVSSAGCTGATWMRHRTSDGLGYPVVTNVEELSPADYGGLKEGDVVLSVNGRDARGLDTWFQAAPGEEVKVRVQRGGKEKELKVKAGRVHELAPEKASMQCLRGA